MLKVHILHNYKDPTSVLEHKDWKAGSISIYLFLFLGGLIMVLFLIGTAKTDRKVEERERGRHAANSRGSDLNPGCLAAFIKSTYITYLYQKTSLIIAYIIFFIRTWVLNKIADNREITWKEVGLHIDS